MMNNGSSLITGKLSRMLLTENVVSPEELRNGLICYLGSVVIDSPKDFNKLDNVLYLEGDFVCMLEEASGLVCPFAVSGNVDLHNLKNGNGVKLPKKIAGNLHIDSLINLIDVELPIYLGGRISYSGMLYTLDEIREIKSQEQLGSKNTSDNVKKKVMKMGFVNNFLIIGFTFFVSLLSIFTAVLMINK